MKKSPLFHEAFALQEAKAKPNGKRVHEHKCFAEMRLGLASEKRNHPHFPLFFLFEKFGRCCCSLLFISCFRFIFRFVVKFVKFPSAKKKENCVLTMMVVSERVTSLRVSRSSCVSSHWQKLQQNSLLLFETDCIFCCGRFAGGESCEKMDFRLARRQNKEQCMIKLVGLEIPRKGHAPGMVHCVNSPRKCS